MITVRTKNKLSISPGVELPARAVCKAEADKSRHYSSWTIHFGVYQFRISQALLVTHFELETTFYATAEGSHGRCQFDPTTGVVCGDLYPEDDPIIIFNVAEYNNTYPDSKITAGTVLDVLDLGGITQSGKYEPPEYDWRKERDERLSEKSYKVSVDMEVITSSTYKAAVIMRDTIIDPAADFLPTVFRVENLDTGEVVMERVVQK